MPEIEMQESLSSLIAADAAARIGSGSRYPGSNSWAATILDNVKERSANRNWEDVEVTRPPN